MRERAGEGPGDIGKMDPDFEAHFFMFRILKEFKIGFAEFDSTWTYDMICEANAYMDMMNDYSRAWQAFYELKNKG